MSNILFPCCFHPLISEEKVSYCYNDIFKPLVKSLLICSIFCKKNLGFYSGTFTTLTLKGPFDMFLKGSMPVASQENQSEAQLCFKSFTIFLDIKR